MKHSSHATLLQGLNAPQRKAVETTEGPLLVLAGAGSGKTRVITVRIAYLIRARGIAPEAILGVTFTNRAAKEMRERLAGLVGKDTARRVLLSTFHAFCVRLLREEIECLGYGKNFTILDEADQRGLIDRIVKEEGRKGEAYDPWIFGARISRAKNAFQNPGDLNAEGDKYDEILSPVFESYREALRARNAVDFDDLINLSILVLEKHKSIREKYRKRFEYLLVDEYQDTNHAQFRLLKALLGKHNNLCVVGDDDQSIYGWRGAEVENILQFDRHFPGAEIIRLEQNYRSTETILNTANAVIENLTGRRPKKMWSDRGMGRKVEGFLAEDETDEAKSVVQRLLLQQTKTGLPYREFAILYRSNVQSRTFETALRTVGIPYVVIGGMEFFSRKEIKDVIAYLRVIVNPRDEEALRRIVNVPKRGVGDKALLVLHEESLRRKEPILNVMREAATLDPLSPIAKTGILSFVEILDGMRSEAKKKSPSQLLQTLLKEIKYTDEIDSNEKNENRKQMKREIVEELVSAAAGFENYHENPTLEGFLETVALDRDVDEADREKRFEQDAVRLLTIHSSKGLEFSHVFLVGLEEGILPHRKCTGDMKSLAEERRLCYVAITRAREHLTLSLVRSRMSFGKPGKQEPSRFLKEIPEELILKQFSHQPYSY